MAASVKNKVHVEYESSDSDYDGDSDVSINDLDDDELSDGGGVPSPPGKTGLADVMSKILNKKVPAHKQVILAKAKTDKELSKRKKVIEEIEVVEEGKPVKKVKVKVEEDDTHVVLSKAKEERLLLWENLCRSKPDPLERPKERALQRIATRGVVQLFNAVRKQQKQLEGEVSEVGSSERRKDKVLEGMTKGKFLNILKGSSATNVKVEKQEPTDILKKEPIDDGDEDKSWSILRDDYMMGAKMKDWNEESSDEGEEEEDDLPGDPGLSDSD